MLSLEMLLHLFKSAVAVIVSTLESLSLFLMSLRGSISKMQLNFILGKLSLPMPDIKKNLSVYDTQGE